ncbi:glycosyltransferase [Enterovibrio sp. ZSDZ42]|uniref:Glycosyltransferase n=1 Tax=Enterovibrio gelatinilyticus TaxID=2899819 RepID=A0ABT5QVN9_9GAMM|nr:glycosyltransferase [Enterovibrio sp. ZSDZ42]MDD1792080.1 glycosyltransferase [Enterovibrio sp. ZSDZ42]
MSVKVLHIINDLSLNGGAQRFLIDLVSPPPAGYEIKIITLNDTNEFCDTLDAQGVTYYAWCHLSLKEKWQLLRWPDVVHGHLFPSIYIALAAFGKKRLQTEHNSHNRRRDHIWMKPFEYLLYWRYQTTVCITEQVQEELESFIPQWKSHYQVIYNGVDLSKFSLTEKPFPQPTAPVRIGMVGRLHPYKDQPTLIRALALLPERYELHFAGEGDRREEYQSLAASLGIESRVIFHGIRSDIPDFLDGLDFYVQSSIIEGFGLAAVEAMAAGLPVLASNVPGIREVIDCETSMFDVGDSEALASMISNVCEDPASYQAATQRSISRCQLFTLSAFREQYYQAYQALVNDKQRLVNGKTS